MDMPVVEEAGMTGIDWLHLQSISLYLPVVASLWPSVHS